jgi:hypothetical protein
LLCLRQSFLDTLCHHAEGGKSAQIRVIRSPIDVPRHRRRKSAERVIIVVTEIKKQAAIAASGEK